MAEVLAIVGGLAAGTQLMHYGYKLPTAASALSRHLRHPSETIETWVHESTAITSLLDRIQYDIGILDHSITWFLGQCRKNTRELEAMLQPFTSKTPSSKPSTRAQRTFIVIKRGEVERLLQSTSRIIDKMKSHLFM
jgi:hypothetical protein